jgi:drug/metabolite transporter (DMT)-like permease
VIAVALALGASLTWGIADFLGGLKSRQLALLTVMLVSQACGLVAISVLVLARGEPPPEAEYVAYASLSGLAGPVGLAAFYRGLAIGQMSVVAPISATAAVVPLVFGIATGDDLTGLHGAGITLALGGVALASREEAEEAARDTRIATGVGLALISALGFGSFFVAMDAASEADPAWALCVNRMTSVPVIATAVLLFRPSLKLGGRDVRTLAAIGLLEMCANGLFALATTEGLVSVVSVLASLYPVVTVALALLFLGERIHRVQQAGVVLVLAAVALISAG